MPKLVSDDFYIPEAPRSEFFYLRMLTVNDVVKDFDAVMASRDKLRSPNESNSQWPDNLTFEQNLIDLGWHQKEFQCRSSFTYTVMRPDDTECVGSVYIYPTERKNYDAKVEMWGRSNTDIPALDQHLYDLVKPWIKKEWPFEKIAFVGTDISRQEWEKIK